MKWFEIEQILLSTTPSLASFRNGLFLTCQLFINYCIYLVLFKLLPADLFGFNTISIIFTFIDFNTFGWIWHVTLEIVPQEPFIRIMKRNVMQMNLVMGQTIKESEKIPSKVSIVAHWLYSHVVIQSSRSYFVHYFKHYHVAEHDSWKNKYIYSFVAGKMVIYLIKRPFYSTSSQRKQNTQKNWKSTNAKSGCLRMKHLRQMHWRSKRNSSNSSTSKRMLSHPKVRVYSFLSIPMRMYRSFQYLRHNL